MNLKYRIIELGESMKPIITKIIPINVCKKIKNCLLKSSAKSMIRRGKFNINAHQFGINLIGYINARMGLGQGCRLIANALSKTGIPFMIYETSAGVPITNASGEWEYKIGGILRYQINIIHVNPDQLPQLAAELPNNSFARRYNIGIWLWELPQIPESWCECFKMVDEIWTPSQFTADSISKRSSIPVKVIPYGITAKTDETIKKSYFGIDEEKFVFLTMYDTNSTIERKNPISSIKAFQAAFAYDNDKVCLIVKINNPKELELKKIQTQIGEYKNIFIFKKKLTTSEVNSLVRLSDVFVSLHRSEGFGLVIAEAMLLGTPVIATDYSANKDFMNKENSCPVKYHLVQVGKDVKIYSGNQKWAEPDINDASEYMKKLYSDKIFYTKIKKNAINSITLDLSPEKSAEKIKHRIAEIIAAYTK